MKGESNFFNLNRFVTAQNPVFEQVKSELKSGKKRTHWMWYVFPQLKNLGKSETSKFYGLENRAEAEAYLKHPILGKRLLECCEILLQLKNNDANAIFGFPDYLKLKSSLTLFAEVATDAFIFEKLLQKFFKNEKDEKTLQLIQQDS